MNNQLNQIEYKAFKKHLGTILNLIDKGIVFNGLAYYNPVGVALFYMYSDSEEVYKLLMNQGINEINLNYSEQYINLLIKLKIEQRDLKAFKHKLVYLFNSIKI